MPYPDPAPGLNRSVLKVLGRDGGERPWRYTTLPTYNPDGSVLTPGVKQTPDGVFILLSDEIVTSLRATMTQAEKDEVLPWIDRKTEAQAALWHAPMWAGQASAVYWRIPAVVWDDPTGAVPLKVRNYFRELFS